MDSIGDTSPRQLARIAGTLYRYVHARAARMPAADARGTRGRRHVAEQTSGPSESGPGTPPGPDGQKGVVPLVRRFGPSILINGVAPYFIYFVLHHQFQV